MSERECSRCGDALRRDIPLDRMVLGLTGNPGAGKSTVARLMESRGATVIDADRIGHELLEPNSPVFKETVKEFGGSIVNADGKIDRKALGDIVFQSADRLQRLNEIVHPALVGAIRDRIERFRSSLERGPLVVDAALIFEWNVEDDFDAVIVVAAPKEKRQKRFQAFRNVSYEEFEKRNAAQMSEAEKIKRANAVLHNAGDLADLQRQVEQFMKS